LPCIAGASCFSITAISKFYESAPWKSGLAFSEIFGIGVAIKASMEAK